MFMFLGLAGMVGFVVCLVIFIISLARRKSKKPSAIAMAVCLVLFIVGLALTPPYPEKTADEEMAPANAESSANEEGAVASDSKPDELVSKPADDSVSPEPAEDMPANNTPSEAPEDVISLGVDEIPGLMAADIKLNMVKWGLKEAAPKSGLSSDDVSYSSSAVDKDTGAELSYFIMANNILHVKYATFSTLNLAEISEDDFLGVASSYLGYCATVPFEGAEPERSKKWVEDNIKNCNETGKVETMKVGNVEFSLYGTGNSARFLDIKALEE
ncbi:MAG: hypothetical protein PHE09_09275 [Oscillospiraceae bacterium]|nr:hypothetical protein [Oscillospiraceae bacterium]